MVGIEYGRVGLRVELEGRGVVRRYGRVSGAKR
jgi:hypothetical protein